MRCGTPIWRSFAIIRIFYAAILWLLAFDRFAEDGITSRKWGALLEPRLRPVRRFRGLLPRMWLATARSVVESCCETLDIQAHCLPPPRCGRQRRGGVGVCCLERGYIWADEYSGPNRVHARFSEARWMGAKTERRRLGVYALDPGMARLRRFRLVRDRESGASTNFESHNQRCVPF